VTRLFDGVDLGNEDTWSAQGSLVWNPMDTLEIVARADYASEDENGSPFVFQTINESAAFVAAASRGAGCPGATFPPPFVPANLDDPRCGNDLQYEGPFTNGGTAEAYSTLTNYGGSLSANWDLNDWLTLTSITAQRKLEWSGARDADNTPLLILHTQYASESDQFSQEFPRRARFRRRAGCGGRILL
jgi:iron complex outermembrane receptor protein